MPWYEWFLLTVTYAAIGGFVVLIGCVVWEMLKRDK